MVKQRKKFWSLCLSFILLLQLFLPAGAFASEPKGEDNGFRGNAKLIDSNQWVTSTVNSKTSQDWYYFKAPDTASVVELGVKKTDSNELHPNC